MMVISQQAVVMLIKHVSFHWTMLLKPSLLDTVLFRGWSGGFALIRIVGYEPSEGVDIESTGATSPSVRLSWSGSVPCSGNTVHCTETLSSKFRQIW